MRNKKMVVSIISLVLLCALTVNFSGCVSAGAVDLMKGIAPGEIIDLAPDTEICNDAASDFAVRLFKRCYAGDNTLISPLSVFTALSMTTNGANGETLSQMEQVLGLSQDELNLYLYHYIKALPQGEKYKLSIANSIWFTDDERFTVNENFLQTNATYYGADMYKAPFNRSTLGDINSWVKQKTDGMIPKILNEIPSDAIMYIINALAFEAEWSEIYEHDQVKSGTFTKEDGTEQNAKFMYSIESTYLEDENAIGFVKYYRGRKYAFVAMLPNEDISVSDYISSLDGKKIRAMLEEPTNYSTVYAAIPKFETEYDVEMSTILSSMGMTDAFDAANADFSDLGSSTGGNIFISRVLHKTYISVAEKGTKAGAVTVIETTDGASPTFEEPKYIYLDRPFVYMLIDCENNLPFFIGVMTDINK